MIQNSKKKGYVEITIKISFLGLLMMAKGGGRVWQVLNPDFRPCVGDSDHHYLLDLK